MKDARNLTDKFYKIIEHLKETLDKKRFEHSIGVAYTAASLAMRYETDVDKAFCAGLLHDCAKGYSHKEQLELSERYKVELSEVERQNPSLIHAKLGVAIAKNVYDIHDTKILDSISYHTTGRPGMTLLEQIIFVADFIEPNRSILPHLNKIRTQAFTDINLCICMISKSVYFFLKNRNRPIDPLTKETYTYYKMEFEGEKLWNQKI